MFGIRMFCNIYKLVSGGNLSKYEKDLICQRHFIPYREEYVSHTYGQKCINYELIMKCQNVLTISVDRGELVNFG